MSRSSIRWRPALAVGVLSLAPLPAWACATCGCTLSADAAMGFSVMAGWRFNVQYDYINQLELRSGTRAATAAQAVNQPSDPALGGGEIENGTLNRYLTLTIGYSPNPDWRIDARVPYVIRDHSTFGVQSQPYDPAETSADQLSRSRTSWLGDGKLIASYQGVLPTHNLGLQLGIKLPTGSYGTRVRFSDGPNSGQPLDASLQAGTGSTDVIVGAYYFQAISQDFDAFVDGQFQAAVSHKQDQPGSDFRPGNSATVSAGLRYEANPGWIPQLQVNVLHKSADQGALADRPDTAGTVAYVSPGLTVRLSARTHAYGFVQVPLYSNLAGYQLLPRGTASVGISYAL
jgi:hypothetical protein